MTQKKHFMPMPDYDLSNDEVKATVVGKVLDERFTRILIRETDLPLDCVVALDSIQKGRKVNREMAIKLRKMGLIEGRFPHLFIASRLAAKTDRVEEYLESKGYDDSFYMQKVLEFICVQGGASREDVDNLLLKHLSSVLTEEQKKRKIGNILSLRLQRRLHWIRNVGGRTKPLWVLTAEGCKACKKANPSCKRTCKKELPLN